MEQRFLIQLLNSILNSYFDVCNKGKIKEMFS